MGDVTAYIPVDLVEVRAWDRPVGAVALDPNLGFYAFEYFPEWVDTGAQLSPQPEVETRARSDVQHTCARRDERALVVPLRVGAGRRDLALRRAGLRRC